MLAATAEQRLLNSVEIGVETQARHGAERAALLSVHAVVNAEKGVLHDRPEVLHLDDVVRAGDDAGRAGGANLGGDYLGVEVFPVLAFGRVGRVTIRHWRIVLGHAIEYREVPG